MSGFFHYISKNVLRVLFITLGTMWLSFAIAPCVLAAAPEDSLHNCCPRHNDESGSSGHMHDHGRCISCYAAVPALNSVDTIVKFTKSPNTDYQPFIVNWHSLQVAKPVSVSFNLHPPAYLPVHPTLLYCVLLI